MNQESKTEGHILEDADLIRAAYPLAAPYLLEVPGADWNANGLTGQRAAYLLSQDWNREAHILKPDQGFVEQSLTGHAQNLQMESDQQAEEPVHHIVEETGDVFPQKATTLLSQDLGNAHEEEIIPETESKVPEIPEEKPQAPAIQSLAIQEVPPQKAKPVRNREAQKKKAVSKAPESAEEKVDFYHWLESLPSGKPGTSRKGKSGLTGSAPNEMKGSFAEKARKSQELKEEIASETLAALLAAQGHREKAIHMYEKLMEKYPEKRLSFAALIEKLNS